MDNKSNKDTIKEMLEGHKKKFNIVAVLIGIAVVLIIGLGAAYVIHTLNSTPKSYTEENLNKYMENTKAQTENGNTQTEATAVNTPQTNTAVKNTQNSNKSQEESQSENTQNNNQPNTYPVSGTAVGNNTQTTNQVSSSATSENTETSGSVASNSKSESSGPQIINPYAKNSSKPKNSSSLTKNAAKSSKKSKQAKKTKIKKHKKYYAESKYAKKYKKHRYVAAKQYVLQVSSNLDKKFVSLTLEKLKRCGYKAYIRIKIINNKVYRRVMVGPIRGYSAAKDEAMLIKRQLKLNYVPIIKKYDKVP